jgi:DNA-binding response OmpR family regulator
MTDERTILDVVNALLKAQLSRTKEMKRNNVIRVDSRIPKEMNEVSRYDFGKVLEELESKNLIEIEAKATAANEHEQRHFQVKILSDKKLESYQKSLAKKYPELSQLPVKDIKFKCGGLSFRPQSGEFVYGNITGRLSPGSAPWSILYFFMQHVNESVTREQLLSVVQAGWSRVNNNKRGRGSPKSSVENFIKIVRRKLGMTRSGRNKNLIHGDGNNQSYTMKP